MAEATLRLTESMAGPGGWDDLQYRVAVREGRVMVGLTTAERAVLWVYREYADRRGEAWPSNESLSRATGLTERAVQQARKSLVKKERLADAAIQDRKTRKMVVLIPPAGVHGGSSQGCTGIHPGGERGFTLGVNGASPEASREETREERAARAGGVGLTQADAGDGGEPRGEGGASPLFERPGYDADAVRLMVDLGVQSEVARGLVVRHRPTAADLAVVLEVMEAMGRAAAAGLKDDRGELIEAVRSPARFIVGAVKAGAFGKPRWMARVEDQERRKRKREDGERRRAEADVKLWESLTVEQRAEAEREARRRLGVRARDGEELMREALAVAAAAKRRDAAGGGR